MLPVDESRLRENSLTSGGQLRKKLRFSAGLQHDLQLAFLILMQIRTGELHLVLAGSRVLDFEGTAAAELNPVMKIGAAADKICPETGAGIVDFEKFNRSAGSIFHGDGHLVGVAACEGEKKG